MSDTTATRRQVIRLESVFSPYCIEQIPNGMAKQAVLKQLLRSLVFAGLVTDASVCELAEGLMERESHGTTALGKGLAIPHLRTDAVCRIVGAVGVAPDGVDFQSLDGAPTKVIFLVLWPTEQREQHFELMGRLSALLRDKSMLMCLQGQRKANLVYEYLKDLDARATDFAVSRVELSTTAFRK